MPRTTTPNALDLCNACDVDDAHPGCAAGYCLGCCPAHGEEDPAGPDDDPHAGDLSRSFASGLAAAAADRAATDPDTSAILLRLSEAALRSIDTPRGEHP